MSFAEGSIDYNPWFSMTSDYFSHPPSPTSVDRLNDVLNRKGFDSQSAELGKLLGRDTIDHSEVLSCVNRVAFEWQQLRGECQGDDIPALSQEFEKILDKVEDAINLRSSTKNEGEVESEGPSSWFSSATSAAATIVSVAANILFPQEEGEVIERDKITANDVLRQVAQQRASIKETLSTISPEDHALQNLDTTQSSSVLRGDNLPESRAVSPTIIKRVRDQLLDQLADNEESFDLKFDIERRLSEEIDLDYSDYQPIEHYLDLDKINEALYGKNELTPPPPTQKALNSSEGEDWSVSSLFSSFTSYIVDGLAASYNAFKGVILPAQRSIVNWGASSYSPEALFREKDFSKQVDDLKNDAKMKTNETYQAALDADEAVNNARELFKNATLSEKANAREELYKAKKLKSKAAREYKMARAEKNGIFNWATRVSYDKESEKTLSFAQVLDYYLWQTLHRTGGESFNMRVDVNFTLGLDKKITDDLQVNLSTVLEEKNVQRLGATALRGLKNLCIALDQSDNMSRSSSQILERLREVDKNTPGKKPSAALHNAKPLNLVNYKRATEKKLADHIARLGVPKGTPANFAIIRFFQRQIYEFKVRALGLTISSVVRLLGGLEGIFGIGNTPSTNATPTVGGFISKAISGYISYLGLTEVLKNIGDQSDITLYYMIDIVSEEIDNIVTPEKSKKIGAKATGIEDNKRELAAVRDAVDSFNNPDGVSEAVFKGQLQPLFELLKIQGDAESLYDVVTPLSQELLPKWQDWIRMRS